MTEGIEAVTTTMLGLALDAASLRQQVTAANIANVETAGYVPMKVSFEAQMADIQRSQAGVGQLDSTVLEAMRPRIEPVFDAGGLPAKVMLDVEVANMAQNAVQYQALVKGLAKHYAILSSAVSDGKK
ncbi:flagellar basal body protein [Ralstonia sp. A12]|uniref:flagellar basal body rod protein FlgB n=1 Tax=Ralstonia sp. A12 TaxID=1217052 RepID=UPI000574866C|nr:flagellar basal body protein [Ralstonia sp. A12]KHK58670.1 flagellar basal body protein [Ralstonia sp. A12]